MSSSLHVRASDPSSYTRPRRALTPLALLSLSLIAAICVGCGGPSVRVVDYELEVSRSGYTLRSVTVENQSENHRVRNIRVTIVDKRESYYVDSTVRIYRDTDYVSVADVDCVGVELEPYQRETYVVDPPMRFGANDPRFVVSGFNSEELPDSK